MLVDITAQNWLFGTRSANTIILVNYKHNWYDNITLHKIAGTGRLTRRLNKSNHIKPTGLIRPSLDESIIITANEAI